MIFSALPWIASPATDTRKEHDLNIAILNCSAPFEPLEHYGSAADIIKKWLSPHFSEATFSEVDIAAGNSFPEQSSFDGVIVSGSEKGVYDDCEWMQPLKAYLRSLRQAQVPIFGICFGHQVMAEAFGGKAEKSSHGFVVGAQSYTEVDDSYSAYAMHRDQVVQVPESATVTASATYCPVAALSYNFPARSVQFHPEFKTPLVTEAIEVFDGDLLSRNEAQTARKSMKQSNVQESLYAIEIADFFRHAGVRAS